MNYNSFNEIPDFKGKFKYLAFILIITGCSSIDCPSFPEEGLVWMPYKQGENINFTDGRDTFQLNVYETYRSSAYSYVKGLKSTCVVNAFAKFSSNSSLPQFQMFGFSANLPRFYTISFTDRTNLNFGINSYGVISSFDNGYTCENLTNYYNGFKEYTIIGKVAYDTLIYSETQIYEVYFAKNVGVIQFKDRFNHKTWSLIGK